MSEWMAKEILKPGYPVVKTRMWSKRKKSKNHGFERGLVLWCDMKPHLIRGTPKFVRDAIKTLSQFQCWLFESKNPRPKIIRMISDNVRNSKDIL